MCFKQGKGNYQEPGTGDSARLPIHSSYLWQLVDAFAQAHFCYGCAHAVIAESCWLQLYQFRIKDDYYF